MGKEISKALAQRDKKVSTVATFNNINLNAIADPDTLSRIDNSQWQIIFGRRGAGKTTLLAAYARYITYSEVIKTASIELNAPDFAAFTVDMSKYNILPGTMAQLYFNSFMKCISDHLFDVFYRKNTSSKFFRIGYYSRKYKLIESLIFEIRDSTSKLTTTPLTADITRERSTESKDNTSFGLGADFATSTSVDTSSAAKLSAEISASISAAHKRSNDTQNQETSKFLDFFVDYSKTRNLIEELITELELEKLYIFIDEWSEIKNEHNDDVQPHFAELIKKVFSRNNQFVFKIGSVKNHTRIGKSENNRVIGLEIGPDLSAIDLDLHHFNDAERTEYFFEELIFRHLAASNSAIEEQLSTTGKTQYGTPVGKPPKSFLGYIFRNRRVLQEIIKGSGSLPRDFIEIFDRIARDKKYSVSPTWSIEDARAAIHNHYISNKEPIALGDRPVREVLNKIKKLVMKNSSRIIAVDSRYPSDFLSKIANLYHWRILHDVPPIQIPPLLRDNFLFYYADLGMLIDLNRLHLSSSEDIEDTNLSLEWTDENIKKYTLEL